jgi:DnaK suppressor protein
MSTINLNHYKELLLAKRRALTTAKAGSESPAPSSGGDKGDLVDHASAALEADLQVRLRETDSKLIRAIDEALGRIEHSIYGVCEVCRKPISPARLDAVPWSRLCRECKEQRQGSG